MAETRIELRGWQAIAALAVILGVTGIRGASRFQTVPDDGRAAVHDWLVKDYEGLGPAAVAKMVADYRSGERSLPAQPATPPEVGIGSVAGHGWRDTMLVRGQVMVDGAPPSNGRSVRYLFLTTKVGGGWMVLSESDAFRYYTALLD